MLVAEDLHYEWAFPVLQFGEPCTNRDYVLIIFNDGHDGHDGTPAHSVRNVKNWLDANL
jgi:hypothetical protein